MDGWPLSLGRAKEGNKWVLAAMSPPAGRIPASTRKVSHCLLFLSQSRDGYCLEARPQERKHLSSNLFSRSEIC